MGGTHGKRLRVWLVFNCHTIRVRPIVRVEEFAVFMRYDGSRSSDARRAISRKGISLAPAKIKDTRPSFHQRAQKPKTLPGVLKTPSSSRGALGFLPEVWNLRRSGNSLPLHAPPRIPFAILGHPHSGNKLEGERPLFIHHGSWKCIGTFNILESASRWVNQR